MPAHRRAQRWAVTAVFFVNGATFASWLPRIPEVRDRLDIGLGTLGVVLLGTGLDSRRSCITARLLLRSA